MRSSSTGAELDSIPDSSHLSARALSPEWKQEANHRLAVHRARRTGRSGAQSALPGMEEATQERHNKQPAIQSVAERVAARYAQAPTYSEMLAVEARNVARAAEAAAAAAGEARDAAQAILAGLDLDERPEVQGAVSRNHLQIAESDSQTVQAANVSDSSTHSPAMDEVSGDEEAFEEEHVAPVLPIPAKLLEFPRELIAARKARPRLAEGPLREEHDRHPSNSQLRIFEVQTESISTEPVLAAHPRESSSIRLGAAPAAHTSDGYRENLDPESRPDRGEVRSSSPHRQAGTAFELPLQTASLEDRLMAAVVDAALVVAGFLVFALVFVACTAHPPTGKPVLIGASVALLALALVYQLLFFYFGHDTPGMRYAKIALCTFDDGNPTRRAMRRRILALLVSASPMGLGLLWAIFDDDRLGWHDRISRTYQRSYR